MPYRDVLSMTFAQPSLPDGGIVRVKNNLRDLSDPKENLTRLAGHAIHDLPIPTNVNTLELLGNGESILISSIYELLSRILAMRWPCSIGWFCVGGARRETSIPTHWARWAA
jgi:hypothetical protein